MQAGLTSLGALKLGRALQSNLKVSAPATLIFDHPSTNAVVSYVALENASSLDTRTGGDMSRSFLILSVPDTLICAMVFHLPFRL